MNVYQMQISYSSQEDRLIMNINSKDNKEIRLFLTRRIAESFLGILKQTINHALTHQPQLNDKENSNTVPKEVSVHQKMEQQIQHQNIVDDSDYETPFITGNNFPMGETTILVEKITLNTYENSNIALIFTSTDEQDVNLNLDPPLLHSVSDLLIKVMPSTEWNIGLSNETNLLIPEEGGQLTLH